MHDRSASWTSFYLKNAGPRAVKVVVLRWWWCGGGILHYTARLYGFSIRGGILVVFCSHLR